LVKEMVDQNQPPALGTLVYEGVDLGRGGRLA
jgi:hypothetical protein